MPSKKIVAIGGGEIGRPGSEVETEAIDRYALSLTGKEQPTVLFVSTASRDSRGYIITAYEHFKKRLGAKFKEVLVTEMDADFEKVRQKVMAVDMIYVGGGNTLHMMKQWRRTGFDTLLKDAYEAGIVCSGISAWANCWFEKGHSDSRRITNPDSPFVFVSGLGFVKGTFCPHYLRENAERQPDLEAKTAKKRSWAVAADDSAALAIIDGKYEALSAKPGSKVRLVDGRSGSIENRELRAGEYGIWQ